LVTLPFRQSGAKHLAAQAAINQQLSMFSLYKPSLLPYLPA